MKCAVTIPVYKETPDSDELTSFCRCLKILSNYTIFIFTHEDLNVDVYEKAAKTLGVTLRYKYFEKRFFDSVEGYNHLLLSLAFYNAFKEYDYILIYQLDAYVFFDQLQYWCEKGYDYIGAPWFEDFDDAPVEAEFLGVGNGGFSLRRIKYFTNLLKRKRALFKVKLKWSWNLRALFSSVASKLGRYNNIDYYLSWNISNEDFFYCRFLKDSKKPLKTPTPEEASLFAYEVFPEFLYKKNGNVLPFGCHAYKRYEFETFWKRFIPTEQ